MVPQVYKTVCIALSYLQQCQNELSLVLCISLKAKLRQRKETAT